MIHFEHLTKRFGTRTAVDDLDFSIPDGAIFGFLGPNGAGKTTTLRLLMGLLTPTSGSATVEGRNVVTESMRVRQIVGYLPDEVFLYDYLTGQQFMEFVADVRGIDAGARQRIPELLSFFELDGAAGDYTVNYSYGMKKKLALAAIVVHQPKVLLLDEPFNGLDPPSIKNFRQMLIRLAKQGVTIVFSSHVLEVVEKIVTHVGIIDHGRIRAVDLLDRLVEPHGGSLETAFFAITGQPDPGADDAAGDDATGGGGEDAHASSPDRAADRPSGQGEPPPSVPPSATG